MSKILITGSAGFIGFHLAKRFCREGWNVIGIDNLNDYYDVNLKKTRLKILQEHNNFTNHIASLEDRAAVDNVFKTEEVEYVVNLAAQAGVRYSIQNPHAYTSSNIEGFLNILEGCRHHNVKHLLFASSSSVYGSNKSMPFSVGNNVDHPVSLYAATKKANELMAHSYAHLYNLPVTGLRFFTVYGPWGRPDMALFLFTKAILEGNPINVFNYGKMQRDFTYIDDIVEGIFRLSGHIPQKNENWDPFNPDPSSSNAPYRLYNIGNNKPVELNYFIEVLENNLGKKAVKNLMPIQAGDVEATYADISHLKEEVDFNPDTSIEDGIKKFVEWYIDYFNIK